jgi:hypothetical protein
MSMQHRAVEGDDVVGAADAVHRVPVVLLPPWPKPTVCSWSWSRGHDARHDAQQLHRAAPMIERFFDLLGAQHALAGARLGLDDLGLGRDVHDLALGAELELHVEAAGVLGRA